jgi:hypothetical protein
MKEDYVSFEIAKLLKEKGFDEDTICVYIGRYLLIKGEGTISNATDMPIIPAPTLQMAMKWLREVHNLFIEIHFYQDTYEDVCCEVGWKEPTYNYRVIGIGNNDADYVDADFNSYESACESAIEYCLENLI